MQLVIRPATISDIPDMYSISRRAHQESYADFIPLARRASFKKRYAHSQRALDTYSEKHTPSIKSASWQVFVAAIGGRVAGYVLSQRTADSAIEIRGLFVDPDLHGRGIGSGLFKALLEVAPKGCVIRLSVIENNERAKRLYAKHGFVKVGVADTTFYGARLEVMERLIH